MVEEKDAPKYRLGYPDCFFELGEISEEKAKEYARIGKNNNPGVKVVLVKTTKEFGGQEIDF